MLTGKDLLAAVKKQKTIYSDNTPMTHSTRKQLTITISGDTYIDMEDALGEVLSKIQDEYISGHGENKTSSYEFNVTEEVHNLTWVDERLQSFYSYVMSFYGPNGIYPMGATKELVIQATQKYLNSPGTHFCGDSHDRELVREILANDYGLVVS